jgi:hypothetical protein
MRENSKRLKREVEKTQRGGDAIAVERHYESNTEIKEEYQSGLFGVRSS